MIDQISVFLENSSGTLADITGVLAEGGIDIRALNIAETKDYGVLRLITDDHQRTLKVLDENGFIASVTKVVAISVPDRPGALSEVLKVLCVSGMNVEYMYSIFSQKEGRAFMVMKLADPSAAEKLLSDGGIHVAEKKELDVQ